MYLVILTERIFGGFKLVGVPDGAEVMRAERLVGLARVGEVRGP
jgi:hypothetical protein